MSEVDYFSYAGALKLKTTIERYWEKRGKFPAVRIEKQYTAKDAQPIFVIRSDLYFDERGFPYILRTGDKR